MADYPKVYVLVEIDPNEAGIDWRRQVIDSIYQTTPLGMADVRAADVTDAFTSGNGLEGMYMERLS